MEHNKQKTIEQRMTTLFKWLALFRLLGTSVSDLIEGEAGK